MSSCLGAYVSFTARESYIPSCRQPPSSPACLRTIFDLADVYLDNSVCVCVCVCVCVEDSGSAGLHRVEFVFVTSSMDANIGGVPATRRPQ